MEKKTRFFFGLCLERHLLKMDKDDVSPFQIRVGSIRCEPEERKEEREKTGKIALERNKLSVPG